MINIPDELLPVFARSYAAGIRELCVVRAAKAAKERMNAAPDDIIANAKAQAAYEIYANDLPSIEEQVLKYLEKPANQQAR